MIASSGASIMDPPTEKWIGWIFRTAGTEETVVRVEPVSREAD